jgi:hypothetical protein
MSFFLICKIREQEEGTDPARGAGTSGRWEELEKSCKRVSIVQILCTHVCKWRMVSIETILEIGGGKIKENGGGSEFK